MYIYINYLFDIIVSCIAIKIYIQFYREVRSFKLVLKMTEVVNYRKNRPKLTMTESWDFIKFDLLLDQRIFIK